jgi:carbon-monoxide dehydrogenase large subunit
VERQLHGGIAQGIGQALFEQACFDAEGNPTTGTLADAVAHVGVTHVDMPANPQSVWRAITAAKGQTR